MKLFVYHDADHKPYDIHVIPYFRSRIKTLCSKESFFFNKGLSFSYIGMFDKMEYLDTTRPFCENCERLLKKDYNINMKQLAINQKLGIK